MNFIPHNKKMYIGTSNNSHASDIFSQKPPCGEIVYTEDSIPVRKLYFCVPTANVS